MVCEEQVDEKVYPEHMNIHGGVGNQLNAIRQKKEIEDNIPKVIPLSKDAPIDPELAQMLQAMDAPKPAPTPPPVSVSPTLSGGGQIKPVEPKPLELKYVWTGNCPQDNTPVRTVITKVDGKWFATAYCLDHQELQQQEVTPLDKVEVFVVDKKTGDVTAIIEKKVKK